MQDVLPLLAHRLRHGADVTESTRKAVERRWSVVSWCCVLIVSIWAICALPLAAMMAGRLIGDVLSR